jgi:hypothetical protein
METFQMLSNSGHGSIYASLGLRSKNIEFRSLRFRGSPTERVPDSKTVFRFFRAHNVEVNCVDPASKVRHSHSEQPSTRQNVDPSNIDEALGIGKLVN